MAEMDDVLAELRHRIMGPFESGPLKPARPQHQDEEGPAMTQSVNIEHQRRGSAAVALRRLAHAGRDGGVVVQDDPAPEPINPERGDGVGVVDDPISPLIRRLSIDMPKLMEEVVAFIERRTAERDERNSDEAGKTTICLHFDEGVLARIDADAKRLGISRTAWLHVAAGERLEGRR